MQRFEFLQQPLLGELAMSPERERERKRKFPLAPMGVLAPGSAHARPSAQPHIDTSGEKKKNNLPKIVAYLICSAGRTHSHLLTQTNLKKSQSVGHLSRSLANTNYCRYGNAMRVFKDIFEDIWISHNLLTILSKPP